MIKYLLIEEGRFPLLIFFQIIELLLFLPTALLLLPNFPLQFPNTFYAGRASAYEGATMVVAGAPLGPHHKVYLSSGEKQSLQVALCLSLIY